MSCFFCFSVVHFSEGCDVYPSDASRIEVLRQRNICEQCCLELEKSQKQWIEFFKRDKNYAYFTHAIRDDFVCPHITVAQLFFPKIDAVLVPRFFQTFDLSEKYSIAFSHPELPSKLFQLRSLKIVPELWGSEINRKINNYSNSLLNGQIWLSLFSDQSESLFTAICLKNVTIMAKFVSLHGLTLAPQDLFLLLTPHLKTLWIQEIKFSSEIDLGEILAKTPAIECLKLNSSNIFYKNSWLEEIIKHKNGKWVRKLAIQIPSNDVNFEALALFMKTKCQKNTEIYLNSNFSSLEFDILPLLYSNYFVEVEKDLPRRYPYLELNFMKKLNLK